ncbi:hypothetical protein tb265_09070 [Gemmatimonadetes bacterium T265]|nr:hypothetical protein tb265_09070 [Gemmatimonadetes bacterium T265]
MFDRLGFVRTGRHWTRGELYVEVPSLSLEDPAELYDSPPMRFAVIRKEVLLRDRLVGFKHWAQVAYGRQAVDMLSAFGSRLDMEWLAPQLRREAVTDAFEALVALAADPAHVTENVLERVLTRLRGRLIEDAVAGDDE